MPHRAGYGRVVIGGGWKGKVLGLGYGKVTLFPMGGWVSRSGNSTFDRRPPGGDGPHFLGALIAGNGVDLL